MKIRNFIVTALAAALTSSSFAAYQAHLFFKNATQNTSNAGQLNANVGDVVEIWYHFDDLDAVNPFKWGTLQVTLCFDGLTLVGAADKGTWDASITAAKVSGGSAADFLTTVTGSGTLYDNSIDPGDNTKAKICDDGLYVFLGINGTKPRSQNWDVKLWQFTVQAGSVGQTLDWAVDGRTTSTGLSTRILDQKNVSKDITDNHVTVVPEPGTIAAVLSGLAGIAGIRRRK
jgi:hypothetical protein